VVVASSVRGGGRVHLSLALGLEAAVRVPRLSRYVIRCQFGNIPTFLIIYKMYGMRIANIPWPINLVLAERVGLYGGQTPARGTSGRARWPRPGCCSGRAPTARLGTSAPARPRRGEAISRCSSGRVLTAVPGTSQRVRMQPMEAISTCSGGRWPMAARVTSTCSLLSERECAIRLLLPAAAPRTSTARGLHGSNMGFLFARQGG
jgi:hypothetical protein